jgi:hypothetical protein
LEVALSWVYLLGVSTYPDNWKRRDKGDHDERWCSNQNDIEGFGG